MDTVHQLTKNKNVGEQHCSRDEASKTTNPRVNRGCRSTAQSPITKEIQGYAAPFTVNCPYNQQRPSGVGSTDSPLLRISSRLIYFLHLWQHIASLWRDVGHVATPPGAVPPGKQQFHTSARESDTRRSSFLSDPVTQRQVGVCRKGTALLDSAIVRFAVSVQF
jgi:hypothetical protein